VPDIETAQLPIDDWVAIDAACDGFEQVWRKGDRPAIEDHLGSVTATLRLLLLEELVRIELEWRFRTGDSPRLAEYSSRYPAYAPSLDAWLAEASASARLAGSSDERDTPGRNMPPTLSLDRGSASDVPGAPPAQPASVLRVLGEYELLEKLGAGGMGEVYKARHRHLDRLVALKLLPHRDDQPPEAVARFLREMRAAGQVDHPNVLEAHDAGEHTGTVYLAMKLVEGQDLAKLVRERGALPVAEACSIARQVALGLGHLAVCGLVHRDIKPSNLMRTPEGVVKILDLGLARWRAEHPGGEDLTGAGRTLGTPDYLAPEQLDRAAEVDIRADLYGLGATLFFLLTGRAPFAHRHGLYPKLEAARKETPPDVRTLRPEVPVPLADLVAGLLAKRPADRPQTPAEVAVALGAFAGDAGAALPTTLTWINSPRRRARRRQTLLAGVAAALLVGFGLWWIASPSSRRVAEAGPDKESTRTPDNGAVPGGASNAAATAEVQARGPAPIEPLRVTRLDVLHVANLQGKGQARAVLGKKSFEAHRGDAVTVEAELSRPAYAYLIAFRPDGTDDLCFPDSADEAPPLTDRPRFPFASQQMEYGLDEGDGLEVLALVASEKPLPPYKQWRSGHGLAPWKREASPAGVVWSYDGREIQGLTATGDQRGRREAAGQATVVRLAKWLRGEDEKVSVSAVGFTVLPKEKP
jgi:serine/threonine protein kinase